MSTMIERVARAIEDESPVGCCSIQPDQAREIARAAIEEMRVPTESMMLAGWVRQFMNVGSTLDEAFELAYGKLSREEDVRFLKEGWSSAIDAALAEPHP